MARLNDAPSEASPLLGKDKKTPQLIDASAGIVPDNPAVTGEADPIVDGGALEQQTSAVERQRQYEGDLEMKKKIIWMFPALVLGVFLSAMDQTIIVSSYGRIGSDLDALSETSWIATAYFLTLTSFQPLYGKMSDIFTRKSCLLFSYLVFGLGCLFCGLAQNMNQLIAARAFAGIGGGGMTTVVSILLSDIIPLQERGTWQGLINVVYATGAGVGAPLGGILADGIGWRWAFLVQAPLCLVAFVAVALVLKLPKRDESNWKEKLKRIDFLGAALLIVAVFCLLFGMDRGSNTTWSSKVTLIPLCLAFPLFASFITVEMKWAAEPFAPGHIIFERSLFACYLCNFFSFAGWLSCLFYIPLYYQTVDGHSATKAGVLLIPGIIAGVSGSLFGGVYMQKTGKYFWLTVIAYTSLVLGLATVTLFSGLVKNSTIGIIMGSVVCGFTNGIGVTTSLIALISNAKREDQAVATACSYLFRSLGSTIGVSLSSTAANQVLRRQLASQLGSGKTADAIIDSVRRNLGSIKTLEPAVRTVVRRCYELSIRSAFSIEVGLVAGAAISAWFIREKSLSR